MPCSPCGPGIKVGEDSIIVSFNSLSTHIFSFTSDLETELIRLIAEKIKATTAKLRAIIEIVFEFKNLIQRT